MSFGFRFILGTMALAHCLCGWALHVASIKKETSAYLIDIQYPQGFTDASIEASVQQFIAKTRDEFLNELSEDEDTPVDAPGKTGLHVRYAIIYDAHQALSIRFDSSIFHRGAAHPLGQIAVLNFVQGHLVSLGDLFQKDSQYLLRIASFCQQEISKKNISEAQWVNEGTKPTLENYSVWYFTEHGIDIIFVTYQVAAYVYGSINVAVPLSLIAPLMKSELLKKLWSN